MTPLCDLALRYKTDKYKPHNYTPVYYRLLSERANEIKNVLEIGVGKGRSLRMWEAFFPNANIIGLDINPDRSVNEGRIKSFVADQGNERELRDIVKEFGVRFDIIVDDGAHDPGRQIKAMSALLRFVTDDGFYFIEDIRGDAGVIAKRIPRDFKHEVHEGDKLLPSGRGEQLMIIRRCS